jgi:hypothetical protein
LVCFFRAIARGSGFFGNEARAQDIFFYKVSSIATHLVEFTMLAGFFKLIDFFSISYGTSWIPDLFCRLDREFWKNTRRLDEKPTADPDRRHSTPIWRPAVGTGFRGARRYAARIFTFRRPIL